MDKLNEAFIEYMNEHDTFCKHNEIRMTKLEKGFAQVEALVRPTSLNALGIAQGGFIYTLADFTLAAASYGSDKIGVSMHCNISYFKQGKLGERLVATSHEENRTKNTATFRITIYAIAAEAEFVESEARVIASFTGIVGLLVPREGQPRVGQSGIFRASDVLKK